MNWDEVKNFPAYICTTKNSDRTEFALSELKKAGISNLKIVYGIDGSSADGISEILERANSYEMATENFNRYGEIALAIAFYEALTDFLKSTYSHMLWFEDDIILHHNPNLIYKKLKDFNNWQEFNLIYLGTSIVNGRKHVVENLKKDIFWTECSDWVVWGTQAMILDKEAAQILVDNKNIQTPIDIHIVNSANKHKQFTKVGVNKNKRFRTAGLLFPLLIQENKIHDWEKLYDTTDPRPSICGNPLDPEWKEIDKLNGNYKRCFGLDSTCWGLFYQRGTPSILRKTNQINFSETNK